LFSSGGSAVYSYLDSSDSVYPDYLQPYDASLIYTSTFGHVIGSFTSFALDLSTGNVYVANNVDGIYVIFANKTSALIIKSEDLGYVLVGSVLVDSLREVPSQTCVHACVTTRKLHYFSHLFVTM
jgi:hypothetical protein